ncbi:biotin--[acetyl-CoA-carboxylase] ligase [Pontixanthobacter aestiaquae]|uniref:biotin--[biotin carboxyl-carrier protein] ligase n=1 Tax=Pontixanthobacter aestiaquae TaxID=1509367 RepID=A0A844Z8N1_9SPHN|nr:biotin--[acetyl-CoA-carboxylase] ligase [Pontixanthobacter aestiaquae]MDN3645327.1 biotin--[acetyl-CoA-carboxylase] ligase [Pontixanthobacter aestiaquae]MXO83672.1 biotin--[acetyl-CoA-carboxylase] ligase [Pontixanthobacter aestiaquae]
MIEYILETGSTNDDLAARLSSGERVSEGDWLVADRQTSGRGRQGREWFDGSGNFMGSTVVNVSQSDPPASTLALLTGLATYEACLALVPDPQALSLKWPNDLLIGRAKLAGILLEGQGSAVIAGIGVNLAAAPDLPDRETVSLTKFGPAPARDSFTEKLAAQFDTELERWRTYGLEPLLRRWINAAHPLGTPLTFHETGATIQSGKFAGLADDGSLLLRLADGSTRAIHAGDVMLA